MTNMSQWYRASQQVRFCPQKVAMTENLLGTFFSSDIQFIDCHGDSVFVCVFVSVCVCVTVCVCVWMCTSACVCVCVYACTFVSVSVL